MYDVEISDLFCGDLTPNKEEAVSESEPEAEPKAEPEAEPSLSHQASPKEEPVAMMRDEDRCSLQQELFGGVGGEDSSSKTVSEDFDLSEIMPVKPDVDAQM